MPTSRQQDSDERPRRRFRFRFWRKEERDAPVAPAPHPDAPVVTADMLNATIGVQRESMIVVAQIEGTVNDASELANDAALRMAQNREAMSQVESSLTQAKPLPDAAREESESVARRIYRNNCFRFLTGCVVVALIIAIIVIITVPPRSDPVHPTGFNGTNATGSASGVAAPIV